MGNRGDFVLYSLRGYAFLVVLSFESAPPHVMATILKHLHGAVEPSTLIIIACVLFVLFLFVSLLSSLVITFDVDLA